MGNMLLSIIIPIYNAENFINKILDSILIRNFKDYEIILINDGSNDKSKDICDEYSKKYGYISCYHIENRGCFKARVYGIKKSKGKYIVFMDVDDFINEDYFENILLALKKKADFYFLNNKINKYNKYKFIEERYLENKFINNKKDVYDYYFSSASGAVWNKIYLGDILRENINDFNVNISIGDDYYINLIYLKYVNNICISNTSSYNHVVNTSVSISNKIRQENISDLDTLLEAIFNFRIVASYDTPILDKYIEQRFESFCGLVRRNLKKDRRDTVKFLKRTRLFTLDNLNKIKVTKIKNKIYKYLLKYRLWNILSKL
ncbi:glycosyltransferase family 2 protein [Megamonas funiformis]|uniref:Glycosyltransferase 2-like domain-containing protein n=4 Tax=Megamonas funiformis TaxID=437897 RepID=A0ABN0EGW3_9FIRM|nr:hypothetical protein HMPREF9454_02020 [Megamonas funiformis YIT 11815]QIB60929.1 glycosyltransferase family 2 protein [Megamonas funiformis]